MAEQRGGLDYVIKVKDEFSKTVESFNEKLEGAKKTFREFREVVSTPVKTGVEDLREQAQQAKEVAKGIKQIEKVRKRSRGVDLNALKDLKNLRDLNLSNRSALKGYQEALEKSANIQKKNNSGTVEEAAARLKVAAAIEKSQQELLKFQILRNNQLSGDTGLTAEREAYLKLSRAIFRARVEEELRKKQRKSGVNAQGRTVAQEADRQAAQVKREIKEAEAAATKAKEEGLDVDQRGRIVANAKIQAERQVAETIRQANIQREKRALLEKQGIGTDGLTVQQRALETYRKQVERLVQAEENLRVQRLKGVQQFAVRTAKVRSEEQAIEALIRAETELRLLEQKRRPGSATGGRTINEVEAEVAAERRIRSEKQKQLRAQKEIEIRKKRGLKVSKELAREAKGLARQTRNAGDAFNGSFSVNRILAVAGAFAAINRVVEGFKTSVVEAIRFNATVETSTLSIAALVAASSDIAIGMEGSVGAAQRLEIATRLAGEQTAKLRQDALRTTATYEELLVAFQTAIGPGLAAGGTVDQIRQFSVQVSQAASALGVAQNQLAEEIRSIVQGTINIRTTRIAAALGLTNEDIRRAKEAGNLFGFLSSEFAAFQRAGERAQGTFAGLFARLRDGFQQVAGAASEGLFDSLKAGLAELVGLLNESEDILSFAPSAEAEQVLKVVADALKDLVDRARDFVGSFTLEEAVQGAERLARGITFLADLFVGFFRVVVKGLDVFISFAETLDFSGERLGQLAGAFALFGSAVSLVVGIVRKVTAAWELFTGALEAFSVADGPVAKGLRSLFGFLGSVLRSLGGIVIRGLVALVGLLSLKVVAIIAVLAGVGVALKKLGDAIAGVPLGVLEAFEVVLLKGKELFTRFKAQLVGIFDNTLTRAIDKVFDTNIAGTARDTADAISLEADKIKFKIDEIAFAADEARQKIEGLGNIREIDPFEGLTVFTSAVRQDLTDIGKQITDLDKDIEKKDIEISVQLETQGFAELTDAAKLRAGFEQTLVPLQEKQAELADRLTKTSQRRFDLENKFKGLDSRRKQELEGFALAVEKELRLQEQGKRLQEQRRDAQQELSALEGQGALADARDLETAKKKVSDIRAAIKATEILLKSTQESPVFTEAPEEDLALARDIVNARRQIRQDLEDSKNLEKGIADLQEQQNELLSRNIQLRSSRALPSLREALGAAEDEISALSERNELLKGGANSSQLRAAADRADAEARLKDLDLQIQKENELIGLQNKLMASGTLDDAALTALGEESLVRDLILEQLKAKRSLLESILKLESEGRAKQNEDALNREIASINRSVELEQAKITALRKQNELRSEGASKEELAAAKAKSDLETLRVSGRNAVLKLAEELKQFEEDGAKVGQTDQQFKEAVEALKARIALQKEENELKLKAAQLDKEQADAVLRVSQIRRAQELDGARLSSDAEIAFANDIAGIEERRAAIATSRLNNRQREFLLAQLSREEEELRLDAGIAELEVQAQLAREELARLGASGVLSAEQQQRQALLGIELETLEGLTLAEQERVEAIKAQIAEQQRRKQILAEGDFGDGLGLGLEDLRENFKTAAQFGFEAIQETFTAVSDGFGEAIYQGIKGSKKGIGDALEGIFDNIAKNFADQLGEQLAQVLFGDSLKSLFSFGTDVNTWQGGVIPSGGARPRLAHYINPQGYAAGGGIGGKKFKPPRGVDRRDTVPIWAAPGEFMMRLSAVKKYGVGFMHMLNSGAIDPAALPAAMYSGARRNRKIGFAEGGPIATAVSGGGTGGGGGTTVLPVMVADNANMKRLIAGGQQELRRFMAEGGR